MFNVRSDNVKNRIKLWRSWYGIVSDILGQSGFDWDGTKHMITVENENAWNEYCISYKSAKPFQFKVLQNWDDIVWIGEKEGIAASLDKMVNSFDRMLEKIDGKVDDEDIQEVLREANLILDFNRQQWAKAIKWLTDDPKQLVIVKYFQFTKRQIMF
ncbi:hypothetical protein D0Y65_021789 [Glycine soja]|uniref:Myb/SANT-like domain-containing protein n=1 Tax=Glycine soja TaxID=3848 RepID=A0A0B2Q166_GLYSO|nr:hypothetical protein glysoja_049440 [Glycine soja]RZB99057.1 hypothetical protein D0Y65_021789 [Glycine soja]